MHISLVITHLGGGGAERCVIELARGLKGRGHKIDLVLLRRRIYHSVPTGVRVYILDDEQDNSTSPVADTSANSPPDATRLSATPMPLDRLRMMSTLNWDPLCLPSPHLVARARALASYLDREEPDCVCPNILNAEVATLLAGRLLHHHPPIIPVVHGFVARYRYRHRRRYRRLSNSAEHFITVSQGVADGLASELRLPKEKITTIYNPVVTPDLHLKMLQHPDHPWFPTNGTPVILAAGRLSAEKDFSTLLQAFALLSRQRPCRLVLLGEGRERKKLERLVNKLDLTDSVSLPGWVDNPFALFARASLFVLSSLHEGLPTVLIEALACGCPCVSTDCPTGPREILRNGEFGPLVSTRDPKGLADAMAQVLDHPPDRRRLKKRGDDFSADKAVIAYETLFSSVVRPFRNTRSNDQEPYREAWDE